MAPNNVRNRRKNSIKCLIRTLLLEVLSRIELISFCKTGVNGTPYVRSWKYEKITAITVPTIAAPKPCAMDMYREAPNVSTATMKLGTLTTHKVASAYPRNKAVLL